MSLRVHDLTAAACGAALAVHAASLARVHGLLAGADPTTPGFAAVGGLLLGWGLAARTTALPSRTACLLASAVTAIAGFGAPLPLGLTTGLSAALVTALLAALPAALVGRARPGAASPALLLGGAGGALLAGLFLLPQAGPSLSAIFTAVLLLGGALLMPEGDAGPSPAEETGLAAEPLVALFLAACVAAGLGAALRPWPFGILAAGCAALGLGLAPLLPLQGRLRAVIAAIVAVLFVPWLAGLLPFSASSLVESESRPLVAAAWGGLSLLLAALGWGLGPGLLGGLAIARPRPGASAVAGAIVLLAGLIEVSGVATRPPTLLVLAGLLVACLSPRLATAMTKGQVITVTAVVAVLLLLLPLGPRGGFGRDLRVQLDDDGTASLVLRGQAIARADVERRPDELLAGHAAGFIAAERGSALLLGLATGGALEALQAQAFREIEIRDFSGDLAASGIVPGLDEPPAVAAAPSAWPEREGGWDALVLQADDPSLPVHAPAFTESAYRRAASLLAPGGVFIQRIRVSRLGPEGLIRVVRSAQSAFPECWIMTADLARDGVVLLVARGLRTGSQGLPWDRLILDPEINPRLDEAVALSLKEALLYKRGDLLGAFAAGPRELGQLQPEVQARDSWSPGWSALQYPAPEGPAVSLSRALLYARIGTLELPVELQARRGTPPWQDQWPFAGLESQFGDGWDSAGGILRFGNRFRPVLGDFGLYRDLSRKISFKRPKGRIDVLSLDRSVAGPDTVNASARSFLDEHAIRTAEALVNGHRALVVIREPSMEEQHVHMTWHCPVQGKLYAADYRLDDGRPGLYEDPLEELGQSLRCSHPRPPSAR